ncbi:metal ABC transporter ATP-binding protein [Tropicibacter alexandrii]|uniref:metal ABC transporter ATP-binding protein n=1 Tax=Tropicibacter alexandrii TaxID=2267683 RepID=UPI000EF49D0E|nr:metal ABC transporter ATP-binding protein [Tropicibacter alexandrii]
MSPFDVARQIHSPLSVQDLTVAYRGAPVLDGIHMTIAPGQMTAIIGPNGAGKSTLLKTCLGLVSARSGLVRFWGDPLPRQRARIAYVPQRASVDWEFPARALDVVMMGLYRDLGLLGRVKAQHLDRAQACLARVGMEDYATRQIGQLSGGQQQRVFLARALAQEADLYLLDEPLAGVDAATEAAIIAVLQGLRDAGKTVVAVHHDLSTVEAYFDRVFLLNRHAMAEGPVATTFTRATLARTYGGTLPGH